MFQLRVIAGPNRGTQYAIQEGENSIGRQSGNSVVLPSSKVSKRHCVLVVRDGEMIVKDEGSSNGTFVNGALTKARQIKVGDRISIGDYVMEIAAPATRSAHASPAALGAGIGQVIPFPQRQPQVSAVGGMPGMGPGHGSGTEANAEPKNLKGRVIWIFEHRILPFFYQLNLKYEWRFLGVGALGVFMLGNLLFTVQPLLDASRQNLIKEVSRRAKYMARLISEQNAPMLASHQETKTDVSYVEHASGVRLAVITDLDSRIISPSDRSNQYLTSGPEAKLALKMRDLFRGGRETGVVTEMDDNTLVAIEPIRVVSTQIGKNVTIGMSIVSIDPSTATLDSGEMGMVYSETLILTALLATFLGFVFYRLTLKPFQTLGEEMDKVLKGDLPQVTREHKMSELNPLWDLINSALQRVPKGGDGGMGGAAENQTPLVEELGAPMRSLGASAGFGVVLLDGSRRIHFMNPMFEEISGIRLDNSMGQDFGSVARDQSLASFANDLCDRSMAGADAVQEDYDFSGISYRISMSAFGPSGSSARSYLMLVIRHTEGG